MKYRTKETRRDESRLESTQNVNVRARPRVRRTEEKRAQVTLIVVMLLYSSQYQWKERKACPIHLHALGIGHGRLYEDKVTSNDFINISTKSFRFFILYLGKESTWNHGLIQSQINQSGNIAQTIGYMDTGHRAQGTGYMGTWVHGYMETGYMGTWKQGTWKQGTWKHGAWEQGTWNQGTGTSTVDRVHG
jgi:hypothetical protein